MCVFATLPVDVSADFRQTGAGLCWDTFLQGQGCKNCVGKHFYILGVEADNSVGLCWHRRAGSSWKCLLTVTILNIFTFILLHESSGMVLFTEGCWEGSDTLTRH